MNELEDIGEDEDDVIVGSPPRLGALGRRRSSLKIPPASRRTRNALSGSSFIVSSANLLRDFQLELTSNSLFFYLLK